MGTDLRKLDNQTLDGHKHILLVRSHEAGLVQRVMDECHDGAEVGDICLYKEVDEGRNEQIGPAVES